VQAAAKRAELEEKAMRAAAAEAKAKGPSEHAISTEEKDD
jgi:hypothetical protein